jgi:Luciferase-like monooxygenase
MRLSMQVGYAGSHRESAALVAELEQVGLDVAWIAEAYSFDAPSYMGYLAAKTNRVEIAAGILPLYTRTPSLLAMTAAGIDALYWRARREEPRAHRRDRRRLAAAVLPAGEGGRGIRASPRRWYGKARPVTGLA